MAFQPIIEDLAPMDMRIFSDEPMGLNVDLLALDLDTRIAVDPSSGRLFINLEKLRIRNSDDVERIVRRVEQVCAPLGSKIDAIINYDGTVIYPEIVQVYAVAVQSLEERFYISTTRYSASAFMRLKLGKVFARSRNTHIFETEEQAQGYLRNAHRT
jgi:propionate CoA-transferase